jgi:arginyl-tRNA synthetase
MLSLQGNTAPYMIYAYVRIMGIRRKALESSTVTTENGVDIPVTFILKTSEEQALAKQLMRFQEVWI